MTDRLGNTTSYTYDAILGKLASLTNARGLRLNSSCVDPIKVSVENISLFKWVRAYVRKLPQISYPGRHKKKKYKYTY